MDETNDCAMKCERGALVRGSDPLSGHSVHNTASDIWRAPPRRQIQIRLGAAVQKTGDKGLDSTPTTKSITLSGLGEERTTPRATSRPQTTAPPDTLEAVIYIDLPCPTRTGSAVG